MDDDTSLTIAPPPGPLLAAALELDEEGVRRLRDAFLAARSNPNTRRAYAQTTADFAAYLGRRAGRSFDDAGALRELLAAGAGGANLVALQYRADLLERKLSSGTVGLRLSNLRAAVKLARTLGLVEWSLEVEAPRVERYRDTAGPGVAGVQAMADAARARTDVIGARDRALIAVLFFQGLRREEAANLDVEHVDFAGGRLSILRKGKLEREWVVAAPEALAALQGWLDVHPRNLDASLSDFEDGGPPLFLGWDATTRSPVGRLTGRGIAHIVARYGLRALGTGVRPHGLRHAAVTALLDLGMSWQEVAGFSGHADPSTLRHYDDNRTRRGSKAARKLGELVTL
jgi:integrase